MTRILALSCLARVAVFAGVVAVSAAARAQESTGLDSILAQQIPLDVDGDGFAELASARVIAHRRVESVASRPVLVIVEPRLLANSARRENDLLPAALEQLCADIAADFGEAYLLSIDCPIAPRHQDGLYVLALRRLLRAYKAQEPAFSGVVFVGHFPEAMLVRNCNWRLNRPITLREGSARERRFEQPVQHLRTIPELVAHTADTVLADLDGNWEARYVQFATALPWSIGVFSAGVPDEGGWAEDFDTGNIEYEDFFFVDDGALKLERDEQTADDGTKTARLYLDPLDELANQECSSTDRARKNPLAVPDILVSRIDPRGVALALRPELRDEQGLPRAGKIDDQAPENWHSTPWLADPQVELDLLLEYIERNHAYRSGALQPEFRPTSLAHGLPSGLDELRAASPLWKERSLDGLDLREVDLSAAAKWLESPAVLRTLRAHSDPWGSVFAAPKLEELNAVAGAPWSFTIEGDRWVPSLRSACGGGKLDYFLLNTLHANGRTGKSASFYLHTGCEAISPAGAARLPFNDPSYGLRNGAQALLFLADGLALVGRAKVFYDEPRGFCAALGAGESFGVAWKRYFELESAANSWDEAGGDIGRKRAYFWSVLGDWTLHLRQPAR